MARSCLPLLLLFVASQASSDCSGDACTNPCSCAVPSSVECTDAGLTELPCNIPDTTNGLYLSSNLMTRFAPGDLDGLPALQYFFADSNKLTALESGALNLPRLGELFIPNNNISIVEKGALGGMPNLGLLVLNNNSLTQMPDVSGNPSLTEIALTMNAISEVPADAFAGCHGLRSIELGSNAITTLNKSTFSQLPALRLPSGRVCLDGNPLDCCGLEWLRDMGALDSTCTGRATCASPSALAGQALKDTKGELCPASG